MEPMSKSIRGFSMSMQVVNIESTSMLNPFAAIFGIGTVSSVNSKHHDKSKSWGDSIPSCFHSLREWWL